MSQSLFTMYLLIAAMILAIVGGFFIDGGFREGGKAVEFAAMIIFAFGMFSAAAISEKTREKKDHVDD